MHKIPTTIIYFPKMNFQLCPQTPPTSTCLSKMDNALYKNLGFWESVIRLHRIPISWFLWFSELTSDLFRFLSDLIVLIRPSKSSSMVHFASSETRQRPLQMPVKLEIEDPLDDEHGPFNKKQKQSSALDQVIFIFRFFFVFSWFRASFAFVLYPKLVVGFWNKSQLWS